MKNRKFFVSIALSVTVSFVKGQVLNLPNRFINDSVKFTTWTVQPDWDKGEFFSKTIVQVKSLDSIDWNAIRLLDRESWLKLFNDSRVDWIANLTLYQLYRKDASIFRVVDNRSKWIAKRKDDDLAYWQNNLK